MQKKTHDTSMLAEPGDRASGSSAGSAAQWRARDLAVLWHPCTQMREHPDTLPLLPIERGEGPWLIGRDGRRYLDAVSSWWTNLFGHAEPRLAAAIYRQANTLEHVILAGCSHAPAVELAERLLALAPREPGRPPLSKVFYADNGSAGVEVALKMAFHWFRNRGESRRTKFVALEGGYHGETLGALLQAHAGEVCAFILEPLVQCAGGMRMHDPVYLQRARELCDANGAFLIADEIATGFGRTGTMFACEQAGVMPDLLCLSKGLTGGFLPLSAVLATQALYDAFLDDSRERAFLHSHSYTGNPLACAAALATLDIFAGEDVIVRNRSTAEVMRTLAAPFTDHPHVADVRQAGMVVAFELTRNGDKRTPFPAEARVGLHAYTAALKRGVVLRPLGNVLYWMPPYCVDDDHLDLLAQTTLAAIEEAVACA
jgi:adenosylmethionine-8-amino-7-oxononanoate aminotransferase